MRFLVDAQLPPALASFLRERGHEAEAAREVDLRDAADDQVWDYALNSRAVLITKDEDFVMFAMVRSSGPQVVWLRVGNCSNRALLIWFTPLLPQIEQAIQQGDRLVEVI